MKRRKFMILGLISIYIIFIIVSFALGYMPGEEIGYNLRTFAIEIIKLLPCAFILIGLFEVWVKRETVERHLGEQSGYRGHIWAILLAATTIGGLYIAFPIAYSLYNKGAKLSVVFTYIGASAICRIPMSIFESSFLGIKFTAVRFAISIPLVIISSILLGKYLAKRNYAISEGK